MAKEGKVRGVSCDAAAAFDDKSGTLLDSVGQVYSAIESVHTVRERIAGGQIGGGSWSNRAARHRPLSGAALHHGERFANVETKRGVKRKGAIVESRLHQANSG